jgi:uncharacterized protein DUF4245
VAPRVVTGDDGDVTVTENPPDRPADGPAPGPAATGSRTRKSAADMVRTMLVIIGLVAVIVLLVPRPNEVTQPDVDATAAAQAARPGLTFVPAVPAALPAGWVARTAKTQLGTDDVAMWMLQYRTPSGTYAAVRQAENPTKDWESRQVTDGRENGTVRVAGHDWVVRSRTDRGITSWVLREGKLTTIVTGTASTADLTTLATALPAAELTP